MVTESSNAARRTMVYPFTCFAKKSIVRLQASFAAASL
jgi:hypothetical protein